MELVRFAPPGSAQLRPGLADGEQVIDLSPRYPTLNAFLSAHPTGWGGAGFDRGGLDTHPRGKVRLGPPLDEAGMFYLVAANYKKHAEEAGLDVPQQPVLFTKPYGALVGPDEPIRLPAISRQMDYEGELAAVIGRTAKGVKAARAGDYVAGYTVVNDATARDLQWTQLGKYRIVDWLSGKTMDHTSPIGPAIVGAEAVGDPHKLNLKTTLNGQTMQDGSTALMVFSIWEIIEYLTARVTLRPGDVIATGTPFGVGGFREIFLKPGDVVTVEIERVGRLSNPVAPTE
jgi:2-keto-4-pentenoate hydratase/2-oxohepta-3-ene-1,7-dioic acid hydratase in catechol pathway